MPFKTQKIPTFSHIDPALKWVDRCATAILHNGKEPKISIGYDDDGTVEQNSKYHAMIGDIAKQAIFKIPGRTVRMADFDIEECKALLVIWFERECDQVGEKLKHGSRVVIDPFTNEKITIRPSTAKFIKSERINFIEYLYATGADGGVKWSEPALAEYQNYKEAQR